MTLNSRRSKKKEKLKTKEIGTWKTNTQKEENSVLAKEQAENTDLDIPVLSKIMITHKWFIKYNFVAPLKCSKKKFKRSSISKLTWKKLLVKIFI